MSTANLCQVRGTIGEMFYSLGPSVFSELRDLKTATDPPVKGLIYPQRIL